MKGFVLARGRELEIGDLDTVKRLGLFPLHSKNNGDKFRDDFECFEESEDEEEVGISRYITLIKCLQEESVANHCAAIFMAFVNKASDRMRDLFMDFNNCMSLARVTPFYEKRR